MYGGSRYRTEIWQKEKQEEEFVVPIRTVLPDRALILSLYGTYCYYFCLPPVTYRNCKNDPLGFSGGENDSVNTKKKKKKNKRGGKTIDICQHKHLITSVGRKQLREQ